MNSNSFLKTTLLQQIGRVVLGLFLTLAGVGHLTWARAEFLAQVPKWLPLNGDLVVILSGIVEITFGLLLLFLPKSKVWIGWVVAIFFVLVFPGNISQMVTHTNAFGLNTDKARIIRLFFQPVLIVWSLWSTGAWQAWRRKEQSGK